MKIDTNQDSGSFASTHIKTLFVAQDAKPKKIKEINLTRLTPFQRGLLVTDGTVTRFIETYTLTPVEVVLLQQTKETLPTKHRWLQLPAGEDVISRQVVLQSHSQKTSSPIIHTYATSLIVPQRFPKSLLDELDSDKHGLGGLLQRSGLETRRELLWCGIEILDNLPPAASHLEGEAFISRAYRVFANQEPLMLINEKFPL